MAIWKPIDYFTSGKTCDISSIRSCLEQIREMSNAVRAFLIVQHGNHYFRSLLLLDEAPSCATDCGANDLERCIATYFAVEPTFLGDVDAFFSDIIDARLSSQSVRTLRDSDKYRCQSFLELLLRQLPADCPVYVASHRETWKSRSDDSPNCAEVAVLLLGGTDLSTPNGSKAVSDLHVMVNASAPVVFRRLAMQRESLDSTIEGVQTQFEKRLLVAPEDYDAHRAQWSETDEVLRQYAEFARSSTCSDAVVLFLVQPAHPKVPLPAAFATSGNKLSAEKLIRCAAELVGYSFRRLRPIVLNDYPTEHAFYSFTSGSNDLRQAFPVLKSVATFPIPVNGYLTDRGDREPCSGALLAVKSSDASDPFRIDDITSLTAVCQHVSQLNTIRVHAETYSMLHNIVATTTPTLARQGGQYEVFEKAPLLPIELMPAIGRIKVWIAHAKEVTNSLSVSVRLATNDGNSLVRVASVSDVPLLEPDPFHEIRLEDQYIHSRVAQSGKTIYVKDTASAASVEAAAGIGAIFGRARSSSRSECCIPLFISGRLVGSINFESRSRSGYDTSFWFTQAFGALISSLLSEARRHHQHTAFGHAGGLLTRSHALLHCRDELLKALQSAAHWDVVKGHLEQAMSEINSVFPTSNRKHGVFPLSECTIEEIVEHVLRTAGESAWAFNKNFRESKIPGAHISVGGHKVTGETRNVAESALRTVIENIKLHSPNIHDATIAVHDAVFGGKAYARIYISSPARSRLSEHLFRSMFREPVIKRPNEPPRLGTFVAGLLLRSIGGEASVVVNSDESVGVLLDVPVLTACGGRV